MGDPECDRDVEPDGDVDRPDGVVADRARSGDGTIDPFATGMNAGTDAPRGDDPCADGTDDAADTGPARPKALPAGPPPAPLAAGGPAWAEA